MKFAIRGALIFVSAAAGLYAVPSGDMTGYVTAALLFSVLTALERFGSLRRFSLFLYAGQLLLAYFLIERSGAAVLFLSLSSLLGYLPSGKTATFGIRRKLLLIVHWLSMNFAIWQGSGGDPTTMLNANLAFGLIAAFLVLLEKSEAKHSANRLHYDDLRRRHFELDQARERLAVFASRVEQEAQEAERVRIARKLHDDIGHRLIRVKMMTEAALRILPSDPDRATLLFEQIREQLEASMEEIRLSVKRVAPTSRVEQEYSLDKLLEETGREAGIETSCTVQGIPYALYPSYRVTLYQNAREALTNALRHGQADYVHMQLTYEERWIEMTIRSDRRQPHAEETHRQADTRSTGLPSADGAIRTGMGIRGMKERTRLLGGELTVEAGPPFTVSTRLPIRGESMSQSL